MVSQFMSLMGKIDNIYRQNRNFDERIVKNYFVLRFFAIEPVFCVQGSLVYANLLHCSRGNSIT